MQNNKIQILSTKMISDSLISIADLYNICIDQSPFIETKGMVTPALEERILQLSQQNVTVIFTSVNAVKAVNRLLLTKPSWKIFCIEPATKKSVENLFGKESIIGTAENAELLADKIIANPSVKKGVFFCGDQRRNVLQEKLKKHGIELEELTVYQTIEKPQIISKSYDGLLFFSPSAVKSFFSVNTISAPARIFVIGSTTASEVKLFTDLPVVIAEYPDAEKLICQVIKHFNASKSLKCNN